MMINSLISSINKWIQIHLKIVIQLNQIYLHIKSVKTLVNNKKSYIIVKVKENHQITVTLIKKTTLWMKILLIMINKERPRIQLTKYLFQLVNQKHLKNY